MMIHSTMLHSTTHTDSSSPETLVAQEGSFQVIGFHNQLLSWTSSRDTQSSEIINTNVSTTKNRGFITRLFLGKGEQRVARAPHSLANPSHLAGVDIFDEEDVLHVKQLPTFGGRLPSQQCEVLLQFLTVPYMRIPLVMQWFSQPLQVMLLNVPELQETLDACLFEPGVWSPEGTQLHVGGTRCVTWSIDRIVQRHACITWGVEFIRACLVLMFPVLDVTQRVPPTCIINTARTLCVWHRCFFSHAR